MILPNILPLDTAKITSEGIDYKGALYTSPIAIKEQWFLPSETNEEKTICVCYDPQDPNFLLMLIDNVGLVPAYKIMDAKLMNPEIQEAYYSVINVLKMRRKSRRRKIKKQGV